MTKPELAALIRAQLLAGLLRYGLGAVAVLAGQQPTAQGRTSGPAIYFFEADNQRYGWQGRTRHFDPLQGKTVVTESQILATRWQVTALAPTDPADWAAITAGDIAEVASMVCNSAAFVQALRLERVGVQRATGVRCPYFENARGQMEASPSFDFITTRRRVLVAETPAIARAEINVKGF